MEARIKRSVDIINKGERSYEEMLEVIETYVWLRKSTSLKIRGLEQAGMNAMLDLQLAIQAFDVAAPWIIRNYKK